MAGGFESLGLMTELLQAAEELEWYLPTDIQDEAIPLILGGGDVMAAAETGSGKTAAFSLPIIQCVSERIRDQTEKIRAPVSPNDVRLSAEDKSSILNISLDGYSCDTTENNLWLGGRGTHGVITGNYYFEVKITQGTVRVGWSTISAQFELGSDALGFGFGGTGMKSNNGAFVQYGKKFGPGDVVGCFISLLPTSKSTSSIGSISYSLNGEWLGEAFPIPSSLSGHVFYPAYSMRKGGFIMNFGASSPMTCISSPVPEALTNYHPLVPFSSSSSSSSDLSHLISSLDGNTSSSSSSSATTSTSSTAPPPPPPPRLPLAVILEPSRDLALQVYQSMMEMCRYLPSIRLGLFIGGGSGFNPTEQKEQRKTLQQGCDIVIGTIGKLTELVKTGILNFSYVKFFVVDEADRMVEPESLEGVMKLFNSCNSRGTGEDRLQVCFFSATLHSPQITDLSTRICQHPTWVDLKGVDYVPETVHHVIYRINPSLPEGQTGGGGWMLTGDKFEDHGKRSHWRVGRPNPITDGVHILPICVPPPPLTTTITSTSSPSTNPNLWLGSSEAQEEVWSQALKERKLYALLEIVDKFQMSQCIIFCRTNLDCDNLEQFLIQAGGVGAKKFTGEKKESGKEHRFSCCVLAGMRSQQERRASLEAFREGDVRFMICTDVAARGIDIQGLPYVINFTLPSEAETYIHRIGRVGRAERMGLAISIVAGGEWVRQPPSATSSSSNTSSFSSSSSSSSTNESPPPSPLLEHKKMKLNPTPSLSIMNHTSEHDDHNHNNNNNNNLNNSTHQSQEGESRKDHKNEDDEEECKVRRGYREKVWYHTCNNPKKAGGCQNRRLIGDDGRGGCTIWFEEEAVLREVEAKLHQTVLELTPTFDLPPSLAALKIRYGEDLLSTVDEQTKPSSLHLELIKPEVRLLAEMEHQSQNIFLSYQQARF